MPLKEIVIGRDADDEKKFGTRGTVMIGKHIVGKGEESHLTNPILVDVARPHVMLILGKRGSGKSYTGAVIAEEVAMLPRETRNSLSIIMIDSMGVFWSMKNPNEKQISELGDWGMKPKGFDVFIYVPIGFVDKYRKADIPFDASIAVKPSELTALDWSMVFGISPVDTVGILMSRVIKRLQKEKDEYSIKDIVLQIRADEKSEKKDKDALENRFVSATEWGIFSQDGSPIEDLLEPGRISVIDISFLSQLSEGWSVGSLLVGLISRSIYAARIAARRKEEIRALEGLQGKDIPITWMIIDEAHQFLPSEGRTPASEPLLTIIKQGRQPGIGCIFITQRPNKLHEDAISQSDIIIAHRLTAKEDLDALKGAMQSYLLYDIDKYIGELPKESGVGIVMDDNSERVFTIKVRPRMSWHAGETPIALTKK